MAPVPGAFLLGLNSRPTAITVYVEVFQIRRFVLAYLCAALCLSTGVSVAAESELRITQYPKEVQFGSPIEITGRGSQDGTPVSLMRRFPHDEGWKRVRAATPDATGRVDFLLDYARYTAEYKLQSGKTESHTVRVLVQPRLTVEVTRADVMTGQKTVVKGTFRPTWSRRQATLKVRDDGQWHVLHELRISDGSFKRELRIDEVGRHRLRVVFDPDVRNSYARSGTELRAHAADMATWYGPGFFGNRTACGQRYRHGLLGVAHRTLPCGTKVSVLYRGRSVKVPVVDRGPYGHANWDLTEETAQRLRFSGRQTVGVLH